MAPRTPVDVKLEALREQGTANPRARNVRDPAFQESEFFDPRDLVQVKYEMLRRVRTEGQPIAGTAASFGVSRPTFYKAQSDFARDGLGGLLPSKRGPQGPSKVTSKVMDLITSALASEPTIGAVALAERIERALGLRIHRRTIERVLARRKKKRH